MPSTDATFGLIGFPVEHSFSAGYFNDMFRRESLPELYMSFPLKDIADFPRILEENPRLRGLNVTSPWKEQILRFVDAQSASVRNLNAANTLRISHRGGQPYIEAFNTDVEGFRLSLEKLMESSGIRPKRALLLGTGGAARAVGEALAQLGIGCQYVSRDPARGLTYDALTPDIIASHPLIVNATPVGMGEMKKAAPAIPYDAIGPGSICFDLIYNPPMTEFLRRAKMQGAVISNGLEMLYLQAQASWRFWNDPDATQ